MIDIVIVSFFWRSNAVLLQNLTKTIMLTPDDVSCKTYIMVKACAGDVAETEMPKWQSLAGGFNIQLQFGATLGVLSITIECTCGCEASRNYFFGVNETDYVFNGCMQPYLSGKNMLQIYLPNGDQGLFALSSTSNCTDEHIINSAVSVNFANENEKTLARLFNLLNGRILMRTMFMKLYYRAFRLAFAPGKSAALRIYSDFVNNVPYALQCSIDTH